MTSKQLKTVLGDSQSRRKTSDGDRVQRERNKEAVIASRDSEKVNAK